jgi:DNA-binding CsgD family transcriptional regulator
MTQAFAHIRPNQLSQPVVDTRALLVALDGIAVGVALLDRDGQIVHSNRQMKAILEQDDGLSASTRLLFSSREPSRAFVLALGRIRSGQSTHEEISVERISGGVPYTLRLTAGNCTQAVIVYVHDGEQGGQRIGADVGALKASYGLTPIEAEVAKLLSQGLSAREIALRRSVSIETVRTQMRVIRQKLDVKSCREAVLRIAGSRAPLMQAS